MAPGSAIADDRSGFLLRAAAWGLGLFALLRLSWIEQNVLLALLQAQSAIVRWYFQAEASSITITSSCSAADVMAVCLGVVLAYPAPWRRRLEGAMLGLALILALNVVRISTLAVLAARWPEAFQPVHVLGWPVLLTAATTAYVWRWIASVRRRERPPEPAQAVDGRRKAIRFSVAAGALLAAHLAAAPWTMPSAAMAAVCRWTASAAHGTLRSIGAETSTNGAVLVTSRGPFEITPECLLTPVFPMYLAAILTGQIGRAHV